MLQLKSLVSRKVHSNTTKQPETTLMKDAFKIATYLNSYFVNLSI